MRTYNSFPLLSEHTRIYLSILWLVDYFQSSAVLNDAAMNIVMHASRWGSTRKCPGLELLDQKVYVSFLQIVWKVDGPIFIPTTSV